MPVMGTSHSYSRPFPLGRPSVYRRIQTRRSQRNCIRLLLISTKVHTFSVIEYFTRRLCSADANHKPEIAIAVTPFTALCGFLPLARIAQYLKAAPEFSRLVGAAILSDFHAVASNVPSHSQTPEQKTALKALFSAVMTAPPDQISANLSSLVERYSKAEQVSEAEKDIVEVVTTLNFQFPGDVGVFCAFLLNHVKLAPGDAIFLGAGEPHAYISGG